MERSRLFPFLYFKSGYLFSPNFKAAISIITDSDSTSKLTLYVIRNGEAEIVDSITDLHLISVAFSTTLKDYNFDGVKDIYIQTSASNGYCLSRGYLITLNPMSLKLQYHPEARELANMSPDFRTKTIISEDVVVSNKTGMPSVINYINTWKNGTLVQLKETSASN